VSGNQDAWGVAAAGRYAITERLGLALRGEYVYDRDGLFLTGGVAPPLGADESEIWSLTGTLDFALTDHMTVRAEVRYDRADIDGFSDMEFTNGSNPQAFTKKDQTMAGVEVIYGF
jgi:hypothetical protein